MDVKIINVALCGGGVVGGGVCEIINSKNSDLLRNGIVFNITKILVKSLNKSRDFTIPTDTIVTDNFENIITDSKIDMIVEVIGGDTIAKDIMHFALSTRKPFITANKALLAKHLDEIININTANTFIGYESSVGGGIPIIKSLQRDIIQTDDVKQISGILNGTTNFILSKMSINGWSYDYALKDAQRLGYAEADPTSDVEGFDALYKICILCKLGLGKILNVDEIPRIGISKIDAVDFEYAKTLNCAIKLIGTCKLLNNKIQCIVSPMLIENTNTIASINNATNIIEIKSKYLSNSYYVGQGAGRYPTAEAVVSDMVNYVKTTNTKPFALTSDYEYNNNYESKFYIRINAKDKVGIIKDVGNVFNIYGVSIDAILQNKIKNPDNIAFVVTTDPTDLHKIRNIVKTIDELSWSLSEPLYLPFL